MALETIAPNFGRGGAKIAYQGPGGLKAIVTELQGLSFSLVDGASSNTEIAVSGITTSDTIKFVLGLDPDNSTSANQVMDFTSAFAISADGKVKAASQATNGYDLLFIWYNKS